MLGKLIERLFVQVRADLSQMGSELQAGVNMTRSATQQMAKQWTTVQGSIQSLTAQFKSGTISQGAYLKQLNTHVSQMSALGMEYRDAQKQVHGYAAELRKTATLQGRVVDTRPIVRFNRSLGQSRMQMMNLGYQLNDIGMTLATGMNPMTVLIQQGSQILQIYSGQGGVTAAFSDLSKMIGSISRKLWPLAVLAGTLKLVQTEINKSSDTTVTFGDTAKAVFQVIGRRLWGLIDGPIGAIGKAFSTVGNWIAENIPPIINGILNLFAKGAKVISATWGLLPELLADAWAGIQNAAIDTGEFIINLFARDIPDWVIKGANKITQAMVFSYKSIGVIWSQLPSLLGDAISGAVNLVVDGAEKMINAAIDGINKLLEGLQAVMDFVGADKALQWFGFSGKIPTIDQRDLSQWKMKVGNALGNTAAEIGQLAADTFTTNFMNGIAPTEGVDLSGSKKSYRGAFEELSRQIEEILSQEDFDFLGSFFDEVKAEAIENALARIAEGTENIGEAAGRAAKEVKELVDQLNEQLEQAAGNLAGVFTNAFERLAETGKFIFGDLVKDLNALIIKSTSEMLQEELTNILKAFLKSLMSAGGFLGRLGQSLVGVLGGGVSGRAVGGVEMPWRDFVAGENGAELITQDGPAGARRVRTAGQTERLMRGRMNSGPNITMIIQTPDVPSFQKSQSQIASTMNRFIAKGQRNQ